MWYVLTGHMAGNDFAHCEIYRPNQYEDARRQAKFWHNVVGYTTTKILSFSTKEEAYAQIDKIERGW